LILATLTLPNAERHSASAPPLRQMARIHQRFEGSLASSVALPSPLHPSSHQQTRYLSSPTIAPLTAKHLPGDTT